MKITICASISFIQDMLLVKEKLKALGHEVELPPTKILNGQGEYITVSEYYKIRKSGSLEPWVWNAKKVAMLNHFNKEVWADAILVMNMDKNGIKGYVGANSLIEMGLALFLKKPIYLFNSLPEMDCSEEIKGMQPIVIDGDLEKII